MSALLRTVKSLNKDLKYESSRTRTTSYNNDENIALKSDIEAVKNGSHMLLTPQRHRNLDIDDDDHEDEDEDENGCTPKIDKYQQRIVKFKDHEDTSSSSSENTMTTTTTTTVTTTVATTQSQKFIRLRGNDKNKNTAPVRNHKSGNKNGSIFDSIDEHEHTTEQSQTEASQLTCTRQITYNGNGDMTAMALTEVTEMTHTQCTQTETPSTRADGGGDTTVTTKHHPARQVVVVVAPGDEIKCCYTFDVYNGLYAIFTYQLVIALLLIVIVVWAFLCTDFAWLVCIWALSFMLLRLYCSVFGFVIIPKMAGLHGDELIHLKMRYLNYIKAWSVLLLYGVIICNAFLLLGFCIYGCVLGVQLSKPESSYSHHTPANMLYVTVYQNVDHFTAQFWLFCMGIIAAIVVIDTIGEIMCYDTIKKFFEAKLQCSLCAIPCSCVKE